MFNTIVQRNRLSGDADRNTSSQLTAVDDERLGLYYVEVRNVVIRIYKAIVLTNIQGTN